MPTTHLIILLAELTPLANENFDGAGDAIGRLREELRRREWSTDSYRLRV